MRPWPSIYNNYLLNILFSQTFAIRFASAEIAQEYKAKFTESQAEMEKLMSGGDAKEGSAEADEAAKAIDSLNVKSEEAPAATETTEAWVR